MTIFIILSLGITTGATTSCVKTLKLVSWSKVRKMSCHEAQAKEGIESAPGIDGTEMLPERVCQFARSKSISQNRSKPGALESQTGLQAAELQVV